MLNENNILQSYQEALTPATDLVDGRSETDLLSFLVDYASLINFYDKDNTINGNWQPFLLKDPVFLSAHILNFPSEKLSSIYKIACEALAKNIDWVLTSSTEPSDTVQYIGDIADLFDPPSDGSIPIPNLEESCDQTIKNINQLFNQLVYVYTSLEKWTQFMLQSTEKYTLKSYIFQQLKQTYGAIFWAILAWRDFLAVKTSNAQFMITPVNWDLYSDYDQKLWKDSRGKQPFWDVLQLSHAEYYSGESINENDQGIGNLADDFTSVGKQVFGFLDQITSYASVSYKETTAKKSRYPDTLLLRSFVNMMGIYQDQWNGLSERHLSFYFKDILKQTPQSASPDSALVSIQLSNPNASYKLPSGTLFNAGENPDGSIIMFQSTEDALLYPTQILNAQTLSLSSDSPSQLILQQQKDVNKVKKSEDGSIQKWPTFGTTATPEIPTTVSTVIASPMFYLGTADTRTITLTFMLAKEQDPKIFTNASYFLSTEKAWFPVSVSQSTSIDTILWNLLKDLLKTISDFIGEIVKWVGFALIAKTIYDLLKSAVTFIYNLLKNIVDELVKIISPLVKDWLTDSDQVLSQLWDALKALLHLDFKKALDDVGNFFNQIYLGIKELITNLWNTIKTWDDDTYNAIVSLGTEVRQDLENFGNDIKQDLEKIINDLKGDEKQSFQQHIKNIKEGTYDFLNQLCDSITDEYHLDNTRKMVLTINLATTDPAIVAFTKNPDGLTSDWPMLKIEFDSFEDSSSSPMIQSLDIKTDVSGMKDFVLQNDFGALDAKKPFQLLGPTVEENQNFLIGSSEIFSKPFTEFDFTLSWEQLPDKEEKVYQETSGTDSTNGNSKRKESWEEATLYGFDVYYLQYNNWLNKLYDKTPICIQKDTFWNSLKKWIPGLTPWNKDKLPVSIAPPTFTQDYFTVDFQQLSKSTWNDIQESSQSTSEATIAMYTQDSEDENKIASTRQFTFGAADGTTVINQYIDPNLQLTPLKFSETTQDGFVRMQLTSNYGFGSSIYPQIVNSIALYNASILMYSVKHPDKCSPVATPNIPYIPTASSIVGNYSASISHSFEKEAVVLEEPKEKTDDNNSNNVPLQLFYETPFGNYKVYDNLVPVEKNSNYLYAGFSMASPFDEKDFKGFPLFPAFNAKGQLFLELSNPLAPSQLRLYFELSRSYSNVDTDDDVSYYGLTTNGWETLSILEDSTQGLTCSGVVVLSLPETMTNSSPLVSSDNYWVSIATSATPDAYAQTSFLNTNGCTVTRTGTAYLNDTNIPQIDANAIKGTVAAVPQIASVMQPFASFDGKASESITEMNTRVSTRLRTKNRCVNRQDYFAMIQQEFTDIYYSKLVYDAATKTETICLVKDVASSTDSNAFLPLVSKCQELKVTKYLQSRVSAFSSTTLIVNNFTPIYVTVSGTVTVVPTDAVDGVQKEINNGLSIFLSPWITASQQQIEIDSGLQASQVASFIKTFDSVLDVQGITLQKTDSSGQTIDDTSNNTIEQEMYLLVPNSKQNITYQWPQS